MLNTLDKSPEAGDMASVSDAVSCQADQIVEGGGAISCAVIYSGSAWKASVSH